MPKGQVLQFERGAESKNERFRRIAPGRVQRAIDAIALIGHLSSTKYEYTEDEKFRVVFALECAVQDVERRLARKKSAKQVFSLDAPSV